MQTRNWHTGKVKRGTQAGTELSYPTVNLDPSLLPKELKKGVYAAWVKFNDELYKGALYFGPRLVKNEEQDVLEIHLLGFDKKIYGEEISFSLGKFIRKVEKFNSFAELKSRITTDIAEVDKSLERE